jgi:hypothetical protein
MAIIVEHFVFHTGFWLWGFAAEGLTIALQVCSPFQVNVFATAAIAMPINVEICETRHKVRIESVCNNNLSHRYAQNFSRKHAPRTISYTIYGRSVYEFQTFIELKVDFQSKVR